MSLNLFSDMKYQISCCYIAVFIYHQDPVNAFNSCLGKSLVIPRWQQQEIVKISVAFTILKPSSQTVNVISMAFSMFYLPVFRRG